MPPRYFGTYTEARHEYLIQNIEGVELLIKFRSLDRPDQVSNLLSSWYTAAWINEARETPWAVVAALQGRVGRYTPQEYGGDAWSGIIMDTNPPDIDSWWYQLFEEHRVPFSTLDDERLLDAHIFRQPGGLTPHAENKTNLPPGYYDRLAGSMDDKSKRVYVDGEYGYLLAGKPVYPTYRDELHCKELRYIEKLPVYRGYDWGLTPACVFAQQVGGKVNIIDELCADHMGADRFTNEVLLHSAQYKGPFVDIGDPAGMDPSQADERTCFQVCHSKGIMITGGRLDRRTAQSVELRTGSVRRGLDTLADGRPLLMIDPKCKMLRKGFNGAYQFRRLQVAAQRYTDVPDKTVYSHVHDALQYIMTQFLGHMLTGAGKSPPLPRDWAETYSFVE
ncbi:MAG: hypothetical protein ACRD98_00330 [Nitrososphaera sp.]